MKKSIFFLLVFLPAFVHTGACFGQSTHQITHWANNKAGAISLTFDDGKISNYTLGAPALNARGFKGTFYIITARADGDPTYSMSWDQLRNLANQGHEIGSHTISHPYLTQLSLSQMQAEIGGSKAVIDAQITTQKCLSIAYPYGNFNGTAESVAQTYYIAARSTACDFNNTPYDFYAMRACEDTLSLAEMKAKTDAAEQTGAWLVTFHHALDGLSYGYWTIDILINYLDYLKTKNLWVNTISSVTKYIKERAAAAISLVSSSNDKIVLNLTDSLDDTIYNEPLTIRSEVPSSWSNVNVQQGSGAVTVASAVEATKTVIYYNVIPDRGIITLTNSGTNTDLPPTAEAGPDQVVNAAATVALNGSGSRDTDGTIVSYLWEQTAGPGVTLSGSGAQRSFTAPSTTATLTFRLTVTDDDGATGADTLTVTVQPAGGVSYSDDFSVDSRSQFTVVNTWTQSGVGQFLYDATGKRLQVKTGDNVALSFSRVLPAASASGVLKLDFLPTVKYPYGGEFVLRLEQDANNYYEVYNSDGYGAGRVSKVVNGQEVGSAAFASGYVQNTGYTVTVTFSATAVRVEGFGAAVDLSQNSSAIAVSSFEVELCQQDAYIDNVYFGS
jgi:peptidoglycan/xylan/chitin deacetylase (PgdA/CDA1 family)